MTFGPLQLLVVGFDGNDFQGEILPELHRLRDHDIVRLVDLLVVTKGADGSVATMETTDLSASESQQLGALAAELIGLSDDEGDDAGERDLGHLSEDVWYVADSIPPNTTAAIAILEHRWAVPLKEAIGRAGGKPLADAWLHPEDLLDAASLVGTAAS